MNLVVLIGHLERDAELRFSAGGEPVASFSLATMERYLDRDGERREDTQWHRVEVLGERTESLPDRLKKGMQVSVTGALQYRDWTDRYGQPQTMVIVKAERVTLLGDPWPPRAYDDGAPTRTKGSLNLVVLTGHIGRDARAWVDETGTTWTRFNLATTERRAGEPRENVLWHRVLLLGKRAERLADRLTKGKHVSVTGALWSYVWTDSDEHQHKSTQVRAQRIVSLGGERRVRRGEEEEPEEWELEEQDEEAAAEEEAEERESEEQQRDDDWRWEK